MPRASQRGQAALEGLGIGVLVVVLLAAVSAWLVREVRPPTEPPAVIAAVATPLVRGPGPFEFAYPLRPPPLELRGRDDEPIGRALRAAGGRVRAGVVLGLEMDDAFDRGFKRRLRERGVAILRDPLGGFRRLPDPSILTPSGAVLRALREARDLYDYAQELRSLPLREAALKASEDAGARAADLAVDVGEAALRRRVGRAVRDRVARPRTEAPPPRSEPVLRAGP